MTEKRVLSFQPESGFYHKRAIKSIDKADFTAALKNLRKAVEMEPDNLTYKMDLADTYARMGLYERSNLELQLMLHRKEMPSEALFGMASNYMALGDYDQAENLYRTYEKVEPDGEFVPQAGDALAFDVRVSCLPVFDRLTISLNGEIVKTFTGETSLQGYAIAFPQAGEYEICFAFAKESAEGAGDDRAELRHIRLLHGQEAADALAANPAYPQTLPGKELNVSLPSSAAREIAFDDPAGYIAAYLPAKHYYILTQDPAPAHVAIGADIDPDAAILYNMDGARAVSTAETGESGFIVSCGLQGESYDQLLVLESLEQQENNAAILYFADTAFVDQVCQGFGASWRYLENDAADSAQESPQEATYALRFVDADGVPVAGVMVNICSDTFCFAPAVTGTDGVATFTGAPYAYEVHVLHAPTGYQWDDAQTITLPAAGGEVVLSLSKE